MPHETALIATIPAGLGLAFVLGFGAAKLALGMVRYALKEFDVDDEAAEAAVQDLRNGAP